MENKEFNDEEIREEDDDEKNKVAKAEKRKEEMMIRQDELMKRGERKDLLRRSLIERNEAEQEETLIRSEEVQELRLLQALQTQKLGEELMLRKNHEIRRQKLRQLLRNDSIELRRLEDEIRVAYAAKAAKIQLLERQRCRDNAKGQDIEDDRMIQGWYKDDRFEKHEMLKARLKQERYRQDLQYQLLSNRRSRQQKIEEQRLEFANDTLAFGSEDSRNQRRKREAASHLLAEQRAFLQAQKDRKFKEKQEMLKEEEVRARILAEKITKENDTKETKSRVVAAQEEILKKITEKILSQERAKQEREDAIKELLDEEEKHYLENRTKEEAMKKSRIAREMLEDMERQKTLKYESRARQEKIDREFAEYLERERIKFLMDDRRKIEKRRSQAIEYGKDLKEAITAARLRYAQDILKQQALLRRDQRIDEQRKKSIEDERSEMLREHGIHLCGFLKPRN